MNKREALKAASATTLLRGKRLRLIDQRLLLLTMAIGLISGPLLASAMPSGLGVVGLLPLIGGLGIASLITRFSQTAAREQSLALVELAHGRVDEGVAILGALIAKPQLDQVVALSLYLLGGVALRRTQFGDASALLRASVAIEHSRFLASHGSFAAHAQASLIVALIGAGDLAAAQAVLDQPEPPGALPASRAVLVEARALLALRKDDPAAALRILDADRRLLQNGLTADDAALVEVLEASASSALASKKAGAPGPVHLVPIDTGARAYVTRLIPDCEALLIEDSI